MAEATRPIEAATASEMGPIRFDNSYQRLPERFYSPTEPTPVAAPRLIGINGPLAAQLGIDPDWLSGAEGVAMLAGNSLPAGASPVALAYAGHQFGNFVPQLGDGRAILLGEVVDRDGRRRDIQLKGSGPTRFSRNGDGRAALGPVLREFVVSEAMSALGIPTTRTLGAVTTGEHVHRETRLPGAVLARVAASHVRIGTFQFFAARGDAEALGLLTDHVIARHYPEIQESDRPALALLRAVIAAQATLVAGWMRTGFIHGVMNTDNMSVCGETIDYGPCAFMDAYAPGTVFSSIDHAGRYAYGNQPHVAVWNLARLAEALLPLIAADEDRALADAEAALKTFQPAYARALAQGFRDKLGFLSEREGDMELVETLLKAMADNGADFTRTFRGLCDDLTLAEGAGATRNEFIDPTRFDAWEARWRERLREEGDTEGRRAAAMRLASPRFIPRNHLVEEMIEAAVERGDLAPFETMRRVLARPYDDQPGHERLAEAPREHEKVLRTFCGT